MMSESLIPIGTSTNPERTVFPEIEKILVPRPDAVPVERNQLGPFSIMAGTLARVFTLLTIVGFPKSPFSAGKGGLVQGSPRFPWRLWISAVSSPHTKAPALVWMEIEREKPLLKMFSPRNP